MRNYERRYFEYGSYKLSYLFSPSKKESKNLLFILPQGRRPAQHFANHNPGISEKWNLLIIDMPGKGYSKKASAGSDLDKLAKIFAKLISHEKFAIKDSVILGKSFNSELAAYMGARFEPRALITIAGPRLFSPRLARITNFIITLVIKLRLLKVFSYFVGLILFITKTLSIGMRPHYKAKDTDQWYLLRDIFRRRLKPLPSTSVTTFLIENSKDELITDRAKEEILQAFKNHTITYLPTQTHWGPVHPKEVVYINQALKSL